VGRNSLFSMNFIIPPWERTPYYAENVLIAYGIVRSVGEDSSSGTRLILILRIPPTSIRIPFQIAIKKYNIVLGKKGIIWEANLIIIDKS